MFDKSNKNYKLYLAGIINESEYMNLFELEKSPTLNPFDPKLNPTHDSIFGSHDEEDEHDLQIGSARLKYKAFLDALPDNLSNPKGMALLQDFMDEFLTHTKLQTPVIKKIMLGALERHAHPDAKKI